MSQNSKLKRPKPGESFEKDEDITTEMDNIIATIISKGTQSVMATNKSADEHAHGEK
jgi:hypothetical protein